MRDPQLRFEQHAGSPQATMLHIGFSGRSKLLEFISKSVAEVRTASGCPQGNLPTEAVLPIVKFR